MANRPGRRKISIIAISSNLSGWVPRILGSESKKRMLEIKGKSSNKSSPIERESRTFRSGFKLITFGDTPSAILPVYGSLNKESD